MFRTHTCGELRISDVNKQITLSGWVPVSYTHLTLPTT